MLTRLTDRIEEGPDGKDVRIIRYGMWGTNAEIERHGRKFLIIQNGKTLSEFKTLEEAEVFMKEKFCIMNYW